MIIINKKRPIPCKIKGLIIIILPEPRNDYNHTSSTGAGTHNFQIASERVQYRLKWHVLGHIRPASTLQNFQYSIPGTCVQDPGLQGGNALGDASTPGTPAGSLPASAHGGTYSHVAVAGGA